MSTRRRADRHDVAMIWAILVLLGVPLWLIATALTMLVYRNRRLRTREGDIPCRLQHKPGGRWSRGHGLWVHDVFSFRASPASWNDWLGWVRQASVRPPDPDEAKKLKRLPDPVIAVLVIEDGTTVLVATNPEAQAALTGPLSPIVWIDSDR